MAETHNVDLEHLSKQELLEHIRKLTAHVKQLKNVIKKANLTETSAGEQVPTNDEDASLNERLQSDHKHNGSKQRVFDFGKYNRRHVALKFFYLGWDYEGYVAQEDTSKTIENAIFDALLKTKLIQNRNECNYHRCGRTDKGVSAFSQVISLDLRSNSVTGNGIQIIEGSQVDGTKPEVNFCKILNKSLPAEIKFYAWADVNLDFSARFDCNQRTYRYFLPVGDLNLTAMQKAAEQLVGLHDFRNFSKLDRTKLDNTFVRNIHSVRIVPLTEFLPISGVSNPTNELFVLEIVGKAFLWHQIRCIVAVLLMVGEEKEKPEIVSELLNIDLYPQKPQYALASELPLVLYECLFDKIETNQWIYDPEAVSDAIYHLQNQYAQYSIKASIVVCMLNDLKKLSCKHTCPPVHKYLMPCLRSANHQPISGRPVSQTQLTETGQLRLRNNIKHRMISKLFDGEQSEKKSKINE